MKDNDTSYEYDVNWKVTVGMYKRKDAEHVVASLRELGFDAVLDPCLDWKCDHK